jgi:hypothetical protein
VFTDFTPLSLPFGSTQIPANNVIVTPSGSASSAQLAFSFLPSLTAGPGSLLEFLIGYNASGALFNSASLTSSGVSATDDAAVSAVENYCAGSTFSLACPGLINAVFDPSLGIDTVSDTSGPFASVGLLGIVTDIAVGGGFTGSARATGPITNQFGLVAAANPVPEPATGLLMAIGLGVAALRKRRSTR